MTVARTSAVVNCPVLGFGQKKVAGFSGGHLIHYYDLGPVKVAPGNAVVPLYAVTNGVSGQNNVTGDTIAVGQTAYPPLWGIVKVTWKPRAQKRRLTSFAAIRGSGLDLEGKKRIALALRGQFDRSDFGLVWNRVLETGGLLVGNTVELALDLAAVRAD